MQRQQCPHIFRDLRRGGNSSAECAKCAVCKLNWSAGDRGHYIFMMTDEAHGTFALTTEADEALADSGCRVAVGGEEWHSRLQGVMAALGIEFFEVEEDERFKFGSGTVLTSRKAFVYAFGIMGDPEAARISCVPGSCPGLVSPTEMSRWNISLNFGNRTMTKGDGEPRTISQSASGHPSFRLTEFGNHDVHTIWQQGKMK